LLSVAACRCYFAPLAYRGYFSMIASGPVHSLRRDKYNGIIIIRKNTTACTNKKTPANTPDALQARGPPHTRPSGRRDRSFHCRLHIRGLGRLRFCGFTQAPRQMSIGRSPAPSIYCALISLGSRNRARARVSENTPQLNLLNQSLLHCTLSRHTTHTSGREARRREGPYKIQILTCTSIIIIG